MQSSGKVSLTDEIIEIGRNGRQGDQGADDPAAVPGVDLEKAETIRDSKLDNELQRAAPDPLGRQNKSGLRERVGVKRRSTHD